MPEEKGGLFGLLRKAQKALESRNKKKVDGAGDPVIHEESDEKDPLTDGAEALKTSGSKGTSNKSAAAQLAELEEEENRSMLTKRNRFK